MKYCLGNVLEGKFLFIFILFFIFSCGSETKVKYRHHEGPIQGTMFHITYEWNEDLSYQIDSLLKKFNSFLSNYDSNSIISKINNNETDEINELIAEMITATETVHRNTDGAFDITVAPLANLWGFGWIKKDKNTTPSHNEIDSVLQYVGIEKITITDNKIIKSNPKLAIIGNAIAQGLSVDYISNYFFELGLKNFLVEIGGEIYCSGVNSQNKEWQIGIDKPIENTGYDKREQQLIVELQNKAIATSGNYRKFIQNGNKKYGHTIDPRTGYPAENSLLSVSVISNSAMLSDAYATAFMVLGWEQSLQIVEKLENLEAFFIYLDYDNNETIVFTSGFKHYIKDNI
ncbi:FAD:protein FMN transferase [Bacteroidales bacterium OttesenSCG-928-I21]|nr:FAD:protein FMN transferase [Bacteroidales bacterium OttesenSCG-928-I21]